MNIKLALNIDGNIYNFGDIVRIVLNDDTSFVGNIRNITIYRDRELFINIVNKNDGTCLNVSINDISAIYKTRYEFLLIGQIIRVETIEGTVIIDTLDSITDISGDTCYIKLKGIMIRLDNIKSIENYTESKEE